jgi:hypothetical protein
VPLRERCTGEFGDVFDFERPSGRCPVADFLDGCDRKERKKFDGSFGALLRMGSRYANHQRFKPLHDQGKPLWEFKEFDHRIYCARVVFGIKVRIVLLWGWVKDKAGKAKQEQNEIVTALHLYSEYLR